MRVWLSIAAFVHPWRLDLLFAVPESADDVHLVHAWYRYLDHKIVLYAFFDSFREVIWVGLLRVYRALLWCILHYLRKQALRVGDAFTLANVDKYVHVLTGEQSAEEKAMSVYSLITDPLN